MERCIERNIVNSDIKERPKRKPFHSPATLITQGKQYNGYLANISAGGLGMYMETPSLEKVSDYAPNVSINLSFISPAGGTLHLQCRIRWRRIHNTLKYGLITSMGIEIHQPPPQYTELFRTLSFSI